MFATLGIIKLETCLQRLPAANNMATTGVDRVATLTNEGRANTATHDVLHEKMADVPNERPIDYEKMEHQAIGVTRIETLWRHFGTNRVVLTSLACTIFCEWRTVTL